ncbi:hypothetical protein L2D08_18340 [Domibacillus sp. PGB-M46]|uniref:immunoglobulin-like domain-containing protein n=1 Tax=Domibacillus sp. PGB-M46 TaxID=2910255 RepID=UPI001F59507C|nr:immunoglobulin-like domain-containing protein [Domibacillus sp. PGB-M46]MCI2256306.1 hypothetical protein [Domibacillus sp. PGB-M46]
MNKQNFILLFLIISVFLLTACQIGDFKKVVTADEKQNKVASIQHITQSKDGITLKIEKKQAKISVNELTITILNESKFALVPGERFAIEKNIDGVWYSVPVQLKVPQTGGSFIRPEEAFAQTVSLDPYLENDLPPGKYRLVKFFGELMEPKSDHNRKKLILAVPFKVVNKGLSIE